MTARPSDPDNVPDPRPRTPAPRLEETALPDTATQQATHDRPDQADQAGPADLVDETQPVQPVQPVEPVEPVENSPVEPAESSRVESSGESSGERVGESRGTDSQASRLVSLAVGRYNLVQGEDGRPYAIDRDGPNIAVPLRGRDGLRQRLARAYFAATGVAAAGSALTDALTVIEGMAADAPAVPVGLRVARHGGARAAAASVVSASAVSAVSSAVSASAVSSTVSASVSSVLTLPGVEGPAPAPGSIVLDLGDPTGRAVVVSPGYWQLVHTSPVLFRRTALTGALPLPAAPSPSLVVALERLDQLRVLLNVDDAGFRLIIGWALAAFVPDIPHPILAVLGEQGTAKTTCASFVVRLFDPSPAPLRTPPRDIRSWAVTAAASWSVALDNLSSVPQWFSDTLCKAVTGDGIIDRALFTDDDVSVLTFRRVIALTSIDAGALAGDLAERMIPVELQVIPPEHRRPEADVEAAYQAAVPYVLAALLDLLAAVLAALPHVQVDRLPRMADFARLLAALDDVTGWTTLGDYLTATADNNHAVIDADPFAVAVRELVEHQAVGWAGEPAELLDALTPAHPPRGWPATPRAAAGHLRRVAPALRASGVRVEFGKTNGRRYIRLATDPTTDTPASDGLDGLALDGLDGLADDEPFPTEEETTVPTVPTVPDPPLTSTNAA